MHKILILLCTAMFLNLAYIASAAETPPPQDSTTHNPYYTSAPLRKETINQTVNKYFRKAFNIEPSKDYKPFTNLQFSGYVRAYTTYRNMPTRYSQVPSARQMAVNGYEVFAQQPDGYQEPFFLLRLEGKPTTKVNFKIEYAMDNQFVGQVKDFQSTPINGIKTPYNRRISLYRILQFQAETFTKLGSFKIIAGGGVNWYRLSPFTLWNYEYRDDMFERYPWEPEGNSFNRYNSNYEIQNIARDSRWGNTGTQGFILEAKGLPLGFNATILYGKTDNSGGFQTFKLKTPKNMISGRLDKSFGSHKFGGNYFSQIGYYDGSAQYKINQDIITADARINFDNVKIFSEVGVGRFVERGTLDSISYITVFGRSENGKNIDANFNNNWGLCANTQIDFSKNATLIPLHLQFYYVDKSVVNVNSQVLNSSNAFAIGTPSNVNTIYDVTTIKGASTDIGQMTNNRWAVNLKHEDTYGKLKFMVAGSVGADIENLYKTYSGSEYNLANAQSYNSFSFMHRANQFTRSRFGYFVSGYGPNNRLIQMYRRTFENIAITDSGDFAKSYNKGYSTIELNLKYKVKFLGRDMIISNHNYYNSIQDKVSVPVFTDKAFFRYFYEEFNVFYSLMPKVTITGFFSFERGLANNRTALADANGNTIVDPNTKVAIYSEVGKAANQTGHGYGLGIDYDFASRAGIYLRHRWFDFNDTSFINDKFKGQETQLEMKIFF